MRRAAAIVLGLALSIDLGQRALAAEHLSPKGESLWGFYNSTLSRAKYIDLTHAIAPGGPKIETHLAAVC